MTAQVEFFCSLDEERTVLRYLTKAEGTLVYDVADGHMTLCDAFSSDDPPVHGMRLSLCIHQPAHGDLIWHTSRPSASGPTHGSLVTNLFARNEWDQRGLSSKDKLIDTDLSPIIYYRRGDVFEDQLGQNNVLAPPSNLHRVGPEYEKWVKRSLAWIRRRGTIVHDYRKQSSTIPNPHSIVTTIYAFPGVLPQLGSRDHPYAIMIS